MVSDLHQDGDTQRMPMGVLNFILLSKGVVFCEIYDL
jgi:hypothetical protein